MARITKGFQSGISLRRVQCETARYASGSHSHCRPATLSGSKSSLPIRRARRSTSGAPIVLLSGDGLGTYAIMAQTGKSRTQGAGLAPQQHVGGRPLRGSAGGGPCPVRSAIDHEYGPGQPVHVLGLDKPPSDGRGEDLDGRQRPVPGQYLHRAPVALSEIRMRLSPRVVWRPRRPSWHRAVDRSTISGARIPPLADQHHTPHSMQPSTRNEPISRSRQ